MATKEQNKLINILELVESVTSTSWDTVIQIVEKIKSGEIIVNESKWEDKIYVHEKLDLSNIETWRTFGDTCVELKFYIEKHILKCKVKIYNGNSYSGFRTNLRFTATLYCQHSFIELLSKKIEGSLDIFLEDAYENHLISQKELWIQNTKQLILNRKTN